MKISKKPFLDPRIKYISIASFFDKVEKEEKDMSAYITESFCIIEYTKYVSVNFGEDDEERFDHYEIALRNGIDEYEFFARNNYLVKEGAEDYFFEYNFFSKKPKRSVTVYLPKYVNYKKAESADLFEKSLKKVKYISEVSFKDDYVVLDVETNGLSRRNDDLLSVSIYSPSLKICYDRFLPLDMQPNVKTTEINGLTKDVLKDCEHINQTEWDEVIKYFDLNNKTILVYSGTNNFDADFIKEYCIRHDLTGYENFKYLNIKKCIPPAVYGIEGSASKDNMCKLFGIKGVRRKHSSSNDCLLEWQLFEFITEHKPIRINDAFYGYKDGYIVPVTILMNNQKLFEYANIPIRYLLGNKKEIYSYSFSDKAISKIKKFPTNITGISIENAIYSAIGAIREDNIQFLLNNKKKLDFICKIENKYEEIPIKVEEDGQLEALREEDKECIDDVNKVALVIKQEIKDAITFIKENIFVNEDIYQQELVLSENNKVLALCDLSSKSAVLEIKTFSPSINNLGYLSPELTYQLFYQSNGRKMYYMYIWIMEGTDSRTFKKFTTGCKVALFEVFVNEYNKDKYIELLSKPSYDEENFLVYLKNNPTAKYKDLQEAFPLYSLRMIQSRIHSLEKKNLIKRIGNNISYVWEVYYTTDE